MKKNQPAKRVAILEEVEINGQWYLAFAINGEIDRAFERNDRNSRDLLEHWAYLANIGYEILDRTP